MTAAPVQPPLSASGRYIVDAHGQRVRLAGVNWYGAHEDDGVVSGLERTGRFQLARTIARLGFNSVRLPFSLWMTGQAIPVPGRYLAANPDLADKFRGGKRGVLGAMVGQVMRETRGRANPKLVSDLLERAIGD